MRVGWLTIAVAAFVSGCETVDGVIVAPDGAFARGDTGDTALLLEPQCADPGFCGCDYTGFDLDDSGSDETCIHDTAIVEGEVQIGAVVHANAEVGRYAVLGERSTLGVGSFLAARATVGSDTDIGDGVIVGRAASIGSNTQVGDDSTIGRRSVIGDDVDASVGQLTMGYSSGIGSGSDVLGANVTFGSLASVGANSTVYADVVLARGATFGDDTTLGQGAIIGPEVMAGHGVTIGAGTRIRKGVSLADDVTTGTNVRIGRDTEVREGASIGDDTVLRAAVTVGTHVQVGPDLLIRRGTVFPDETAGPGGDPFAADEPPIIVITSPSHGADTASGSLTITGTVSDDNGLASVQVRVDDGAFVTVNVVNGTFTHTVTAIPDMSNSIEARAVDTIGQVGKDMLYVSDSNPTRSFSHVWTGGASTDWNTASNWNVNSVPNSGSLVRIPNGPSNQPVLTSTVTVGQVWLDYGAVIDTSVHSLQINNTLSGGEVVGAGGVTMLSGNIRGRVENLDVTGLVYLSGYLHVTDAMTIPQGAGRVILNNEVMRVSGPYSQAIDSSTDGLYMNGATALAHLDGGASFSGTANMNSNTMLQGRITVGGAMSVACTSTYACLAVTGTTFEFDGSAPQTVNFTYPGTSYNRFANVVVTNPTGVALSSNTGTLASTGTLWLHNGGAMSVSNMVFGATGGTNRLDGNAVLTGTGTVDFSGDVSVQDSSVMSGNVFVFGQALSMAPGSGMVANRVDMESELPVTSDFYTATNTRLIGLAYANTDFDLKMPRFEIPTGAGRLIIGDATVTLTGDFIQAIDSSTDGLYFNHANARVEVAGSASFGGTANMNSNTMLQGVMTVAGDMSVACTSTYACVASTGTRFEFDGSSAQTVNFTYPGTSYNRFDDVVVRNASGVSFTRNTGTLAATGVLTVDGGSMTTQPFTFTGVSGTSVLSNGAMLTNTGTLSIASDVNVLDTSDVNGDVLVFSRGLSMDPSAVLFANRVDMVSELPVTSDFYTATNTRLIGLAYANTDFDLKMPQFEIPTGAGRLIIGDATVTLTGDFIQAIDSSTDGLYFNHANARVEVAGSASFGGTANMNSNTMLQGVMTVAGDMSVACSSTYACVASTGTRFEFDGSLAQTVNFTYPGTSYNRFHDVVVRNASGVSFTRNTGTLVATGVLTVDGGSMTTQPFTFTGVSGTSVLSNGAMLTNTGTLSIASDVNVLDTSDVNGDVLVFGRGLNMDPSAVLFANRVDMVSELPVTSDFYTATNTRLIGLAYANTDFDLKMPQFEIPTGAGRLIIGDATVTLTGDFIQAIDSSTDGLYFNHANARVEVAGSASFGGTANMNSNTMLQGVMTVAGDMSVACTSTYACFASTGMQMVFDGSAQQLVNFTYPGASYNRFASVVVAPSADVQLNSNIYASSFITVTGALTNVGGRTADTNADLTIDGGSLTNSGTFRYNGALNVINGGSVSGNTPVNY